MTTARRRMQRDRILHIAGRFAIANVLLALAEPVFDLDPNAWWWLTFRTIVFVPMVALSLVWLGLVLRDRRTGARDSS